MPRLELTAHLARHVDCPSETVDGGTVREVLDARGVGVRDAGALRRLIVTRRLFVSTRKGLFSFIESSRSGPASASAHAVRFA